MNRRSFRPEYQTKVADPSRVERIEPGRKD